MVLKVAAKGFTNLDNSLNVSACLLKHKLKLCRNDIGLRFVYLPEIAFIFLPISLDLCFGCSRDASH